MTKFTIPILVFQFVALAALVVLLVVPHQHHQFIHPFSWVCASIAIALFIVSFSLAVASRNRN